MVDGGSPPSVITTSWGQCEAQLPPAYLQAEASIFQQAVAQGQTVVAAGGRRRVRGLLLVPELQRHPPRGRRPGQPTLGHGGGRDHDQRRSGPPPTESVWNLGLFSGTGGGGISTTWTMPAWQRGPGVQSTATRAQDAFTGAQPCPTSSGAGTVSCREVPDVAADADPRTGLAIFCSCPAAGGPRSAAPAWLRRCGVRWRPWPTRVSRLAGGVR